MISMLWSGELRFYKVWKLITMAVPVIFCMIALIYIALGKRKEKNNDAGDRGV